MTYDVSALAEYGWSPFFSAQLDIDDLTSGRPARVVEVHRSLIRVAAPDLDHTLPPVVDADADAGAATVGDWLLLDAASLRPKRLLDRKSLFQRRAPGIERKRQLIAANVDTLFLVTSCNQEFSTARLERYLALAREAEVTPVVVLTKPDLTPAPDGFAEAAAALLPGLIVETVDAREAGDADRLAGWCGRGRTVALVGSSGVGKSTLINTLIGGDIRTGDIRQSDARGRHTTSARVLHRLPAGGWLLDTPGMRELQLTDARAGLGEVFADIEELAGACRFADCGHDSEPGCAVRAALEAGTLDPGRLANWKKLLAEEAYNTASLAERRQRSRAFGKMVRQVMKEKQTRRRD